MHCGLVLPICFRILYKWNHTVHVCVWLAAFDTAVRFVCVVRGCRTFLFITVL